MKTTKEIIEVMNAYDDGAEIEFQCDLYSWKITENPLWNWENKDYRIKKYPYPMWFKRNDNALLVKFTGLTSGIRYVTNLGVKVDEEAQNNWTPHTNKNIWVQVAEQKNKTTYYEVIRDINRVRPFVDTNIYKEEEIKPDWIKTGRSWEL